MTDIRDRTLLDYLVDQYWLTRWRINSLSGVYVADAQAITDPLWVDSSENQGCVNVPILKANNVQGIAARAGRTWYAPAYYKDPLFDSTYQAAGDNELYRTSYHVTHTNVNDAGILAQTDLWYSVHKERDIVARWIDLEVDKGDPAWHKAEITWRQVEIVKSRDGVYPTIYSRTNLVNAWLAPYWSEEQMNLVTWALAQYLTDRTREHPGPPTLPLKVRADRVVFHQTADKIAGWIGAICSSALDRDRFLLAHTIEGMKIWIQNNWGGGVVIPPTDPNPTLPPFPIGGGTMPLQDVLLKSKMVLQAGVALTGVNQDTAITVPNLPPNVKGLKLWMIVKSDKPGAFVFFSPGLFGEERYHIGARAQVANLEIDEVGDLLLDGAKFYRQHDAKGGIVTYWLYMTGYKVDVPQQVVDLTPINDKLAQLDSYVKTLATKNELSAAVAGAVSKVKNAILQAANSL